MRRTKKGALVAAVMGTTLFAGCLGTWWNFAIQGMAGSVLAEWLLDNDGVFDLFEDGGTAQ